jgi:hypothetical protein
MYRDTSAIARIHHSFAGGMNEHGLELILSGNGHYGTGLNHRQLLELNVGKMMWCYAPAIETALTLGRSNRQVQELRRWQYGGSIRR